MLCERCFFIDYISIDHAKAVDKCNYLFSY